MSDNNEVWDIYYGIVKAVMSPVCNSTFDEYQVIWITFPPASLRTTDFDYVNSPRTESWTLHMG